MIQKLNLESTIVALIQSHGFIQFLKSILIIHQQDLKKGFW